MTDDITGMPLVCLLLFACFDVIKVKVELYIYTRKIFLLVAVQEGICLIVMHTHTHTNTDEPFVHAYTLSQTHL